MGSNELCIVLVDLTGSRLLLMYVLTLILSGCAMSKPKSSTTVLAGNTESDEGSHCCRGRNVTGASGGSPAIMVVLIRDPSVGVSLCQEDFPSLEKE